MEESFKFSGIERLFGAGSVRQLLNGHVCVMGIGGVGSWAVEALARSGVGEITLVDLDDLCTTNINRQIHALEETVGRSKIEVMKERIYSINPDCKVHLIDEFFSHKNSERILSVPFDYVIDACDAAISKCLLIAECVRRNIPIITCGGAGGKLNPSLIEIKDLSETRNDRLSQTLRKELRRDYNFPRGLGAFGVLCVYSPEMPYYWHESGTVTQLKKEDHKNFRLDCHTGYGTASFVTSCFGMMAAGEVIKKICQNAN